MSSDSLALTPAELLMGARRAAAKAAPYLARAIYAITFVAEKGVPTLGIDEHWRVYYNPEYVRKIAPLGLLPSAIIHETLHPTLRHSQRAKMQCCENHKAWNICGDAELNQQIEAMTYTVKDAAGSHTHHMPVSPDWVHWSHLPGDCKAHETTEEYYAKARSASDNGGQGKGEPCSGGSGTTGQPQEWEQGAPSASAPGMTQAEADLVRASTASDIKKHAENVQGRGSIPGGLLRWAETFSDPPPVDWLSLTAARVAYQLDMRRGSSPSYSRPSRRQLDGGLVLPVYRTAVPNICLVLDTSGSMGEEDISKGLACIVDAIDNLGKLHVVACDSAATEATQVRHIDDLREYLTGGGGTDMCAGIRNAEETRADVIVVVTDGDTPWPGAAPETPIVVVLTREPYAAPPSWAEVIRMPPR